MELTRRVSLLTRCVSFGEAVTPTLPLPRMLYWAMGTVTFSDLERIERKLIEHDGEFKLIKFMLGMLIGGVVALGLKSFF